MTRERKDLSQDNHTGAKASHSPFRAGRHVDGEHVVGRSTTDMDVDVDVDVGLAEARSPLPGWYHVSPILQKSSVSSESIQGQSCLSRRVHAHQELTNLNLSPVTEEGDMLAGRVALAVGNWERITQDPEVLRMIMGCPIPFIETPPPNPTGFQPRFSAAETTLLHVEVSKLMAKGAIVPVETVPDQFVGHLFLRQKKDGSQRPIFNLRPLNAWVAYRHFKMEGLPMLKGLIQSGDWLLKLDLQDAYFCVAILAEHRKFLRFWWERQLYEFQCLPFGLASAPRQFTKILKPVVGLLRKLGIRLLIYLDDILIMNQSQQSILQDGKTVVVLLEALGFVLNMKKSVVVPSQRMEFLGVVVDSQAMTFSLPEDKIANIFLKCSEMLKMEEVSVRQLSKLTGVLVSSALAVLPGPLHYRQLQMVQARALMKGLSYESMVMLSADAKREIRWWMEMLQQTNGKAIISPGPDLVIETDASRQGWGAAMGAMTVRGHWTEAEQEEHINVLELRAVLFAVQALCSAKSNMHLHIKADNITAVAHINKMGGTRSDRCVQVTTELWEFCLERKLLLSAEYLPGVENVRADALSRNVTRFQ